MLSCTKEELLGYLQANNYPYFIDESNRDERYERNYFRKVFSDPLLSQYKEGIKRSFDYMRKDKEPLEKSFKTLYSEQKLKVIKIYSDTVKVKAVDLALKQLGYLLSAAQRIEIEKEKSLVIGGEWAIELQNDLLYIAPYITIDMPKIFKEKCRVLKIPNKIRPYCFREKIDIQRFPM